MKETAVFGSVFVDVKGFAFANYQPTGRNLGDVKITHGGVCRNVAENLANLGCPVNFVTMLDAGAMGNDVRMRLLERGVMLKYAVNAVGGMGMWLAVMNERGELAGSISRQPDFSQMEKLVKARGEEIVRACQSIVLEIDMNAEIARLVLDLARRYDREVYALVGNMGVILAHPEYLSQLRLFILNEVEAGALFGCTLNPAEPEAVLARAQMEARRLGIREIVVTLGPYGSVYYDGTNGESGIVAAEPTHVADCTGAGDAFFSGVVAARNRGMNLGDAARLGAHLAALTLRSEESTCPRMENFFAPEAEAI